MRLIPILILFNLIVLVGCENTDANTSTIEMQKDSINVPVEIIGKIDDKEVKAYTIRNANNFSLTVLNYGGIVQRFDIIDGNGNKKNIVLGFDKLEGYLQEGNPYIGALIGRYANRIANGKININGKEYSLTQNNDGNTLHSGNIGFHNVIWDVEPLSNSSLLLKYLSPDGQEGFPGNVSVEVIYILTDENEWIIDYHAKTDKATPINFTQHTYFNLDGFQQSNDILNHEITIHADKYTPVNLKMIPTGEIVSVQSTPLDFRRAKLIGKDIQQLKGGYDHNLIFKQNRNLDEPVAIVRDSASNLALTMYTTEPAVQFFTAGVLNRSLKHTIHQKEYPVFAGFCLEAQRFPNAPNQSNFPNTILRPGETYFQKTIYKISTE